MHCSYFKKEAPLGGKEGGLNIPYPWNIHPISQDRKLVFYF